MVVKLNSIITTVKNVFESSVISYGSKAWSDSFIDVIKFESSVISYGSKA